MHVTIDYPAVEAERDILNLVRNEAANVEGLAPEQVVQADLFAARQEVLAMHMAPEVEEYIIQLVMATRNPGCTETISKPGSNMEPALVARFH